MHPRARVLLLLASLACAGGDGPGPSPPPPPPPPGPPAPLAASVTMGTAEDPYGAQGPAFVPPLVTIQRGGTVTWTNGSGLEHTVTFAAATGAPANIPVHASGANVRTFPTPGEFNYACQLHPTMTGRVVVQ